MLFRFLRRTSAAHHVATAAPTFARRASASLSDLFTSPAGLTALLYGRTSLSEKSDKLSSSGAQRGEPPKGRRRIGRNRKETSTDDVGPDGPPKPSRFHFLTQDAVGLALLIFILSALWELLRSQQYTVMEKCRGLFMTTLEVRSSQEEFAMIVDWMARQPRGKRARNVTLRPMTLQDEQMVEDGKDAAVSDGEQRAALVPGYGAHFFAYDGVWMWVRREFDSSKKHFAATHIDRENDVLTLSFLTRNRTLLDRFLTEVRSSWEAHVQNRVRIYYPRYGDWRLLTEKPRRSLDTLYLAPDVMQLVEEARCFFALRDVYAELGIPWRRGYLFEGPPGTGKSSLTVALAGELQVPVYVLSLQSSWIDDDTLLRCVSQLPSKSILLIEDVENAVKRNTSSSREVGHDLGEEVSSTEVGGSSRAAVSMSGLLNALDGITSTQGRLLIVTTNDASRIPSPVGAAASWAD
ncbi:mitochondrial chaperone BCS1 [Strigomonas culicis]|uniref:Mitochondrial chaperone BCS1 n=1 Tax=Strigomonas culicis TaxID=28005 RepID=S9UAT4_9TRYP|nr:mitochondrial chaperone BCS1 [Strigomonas culicis]|eukprot:EPY27907.1 mitochondrial chaperone BCS1 [Strigomonas culicis]